MQKIYISIICSTLFSLWSCTKTEVLPETAKNQSAILFYGSDYGHDLKSFEATSDGGFIFGGSTHSSSANEQQAFIQKTDKNGKVLWYKNYGGSLMDRFDALHETSDGGFIGVGATTSSGSGIARQDFYANAYFVKTDGQGNVQWEESFSFGGILADQLFDVAETPDHGFVAVGFYTYGAGGCCTIVLKVDKDGNGIWAQGLLASVYRSYGAAVAVTPEGNIAVASYVVKSNLSSEQVFFYPAFSYLTSSGQILNPGTIYTNFGTETVTYNNENPNKLESLLLRPDGLIFATNLGYPYSANPIPPSVVLFKIDFNGNLLWNQKFQGLSNASAASLSNGENGGFLLSGATHDAGGNPFGWLLSTDASGNQLWEATVPLNGNLGFIAGAHFQDNKIATGVEFIPTISKHANFFGFATFDKSGKLYEKSR